MRTILIISLACICSFCSAQKYYLTFDWSPDSKQILATVESWQGEVGSYRLDLINVKSGKSRMIVEKGWAPAWSPDGKRIAYTAKTTGGQEIFIANADGTSERQLTTNEFDDQEPSFSPDGRHLVFDSNRNGKSQLFKMNLDGSDQEQVFISEESVYTPSWSRDGKKILYYKDKGDRMDKVCVYDLALQSEVLITNNERHNFYPSWTMDGNILFSSGPGGRFEPTQIRLFVVSSNGEEPTAVGDFAVRYAKMSPNGKNIAYTQRKEGGDEHGFRNEIFICDRNGSGNRAVTTH